MTKTICIIGKEDIPKYEIARGDVLNSIVDQSKRKEDILRAMKLGNNDHQKVKIVFETTDGTMGVETTVWEVTENYMILKSNMALPVRCVHRIDFYD